MTLEDRVHQRVATGAGIHPITPMDATSPRWQQVTTSQYAWEAEALEHLRALLPDSDPYRAWTNFEFTDGGAIYEVDALVVTVKGVWIVEVKSWSGKVTGDQGTWVQRRMDGSRMSYANQAAVNHRKARALASLLQRNWPGRGHDSIRVPYIGSLVWFSNPRLEVALPVELRPHIAITDDNDTTHSVQTLTQAILEIGSEEAKRADFRRITTEQAERLTSTMARIGLKESTRKRTAGSYELQLPAFAERGSTQDFMATHTLQNLPARVRIYSNVVDASPEDAKALRDAATREYVAGENLPLDGVVRARDFVMTDFGPAVIFDHRSDSVRLDRFMAELDDPLDLPTALGILEDLASTVRDVHGRRITHRMLTPESVWLRPSHDTHPAAGANTTGTKTAGAKNAGAGASTGAGAHASGTATSPVTYRTQIADFSLAAREGTNVGNTVATYTRVGSFPAARTGAIDVVLGDPAAETYLAPEAFSDPNADGVALDVFSIGALAHLLCTSRAPAADRNAMHDALGSGGLSLANELPGVDPMLAKLVRDCTNPVVSERISTMAEVVDTIALIRATLAGEATDETTDPMVAGPGDVLADRYRVQRRLGKGSTAIALWCQDLESESDVVLKVSLGSVCDDRIRAEGQALADLTQENLVKLYDQIELAGRPTLVLSFAGERSLATYLRDEGSVGTEFLRRWGEDLLEAVRYLEKSGVAHRDIKPDNLGITELGPHKEPHLVLFDLSLAGTRSEDLYAGTPPYLDPFLGEPTGRTRFDLAAERYAAAVTIHEMATGEPPLWGDGRTNPAFLPDDVEATILVESLDPEVRGPLAEFLTRSLRRDATQRFDTADDMARAWLAVFADWEASGGDEDVDQDSPIDDRPSAQDRSDKTVSSKGHRFELPENLSLGDPIRSLRTSKKIRSALHKAGADTIGQITTLEPVEVNRLRGVASRTRREVLAIRAAVLERFADDLKRSAAKAGTTGRTTTTPTQVSDITDIDVVFDLDESELGKAGSDASAPDAPAGASPVFERVDLDQLALSLIPPAPKRGRKGTAGEQIRMLIGWDRPYGTTGDDWPTAGAVAERMDLTRAAVAQTHQKARKHWAKSQDLSLVAVDLLGMLADLGGVAGVSELTTPLIAARGTGREGQDAERLATAVIRAAIDSSASTSGWFSTRRFGRRTLVAIDGQAITKAHTDATSSRPTGADADMIRMLLAELGDDTLHHLSGFDPAALIDLAVRLGERADELVATGPTRTVVPSTDAVPALRSVRTTAGAVLSDSRLVRLAVAASDSTATNSASDLVPLDLSPIDALRWSRTTLIASNRLTISELSERVAARFPTVALPQRPQLDEALTAADLPFEWVDDDTDPTSGAYILTREGPSGVGHLSIAESRRQTQFDTSGLTVAPRNSDDPLIVEALRTDERLQQVATHGGFLTLRAPTDHLGAVRGGLARYQNEPYSMTFVDLEARFMANLHAVADRRRVRWSNLELADDRDDPNWARLSDVAEEAVDATVDEVINADRVIAFFPGALVRHAPLAKTAPLDRLREAATSIDHPLHALWLVVLGGTADASPMVDGQPVPVLGPSEWMDLPITWLENRHRSGEISA